MDTFSESLDLKVLAAIDKKMAEEIENTPNISANRSGRQRSKTVNGSSFLATSDAEIIEDSPIASERLVSIRGVRTRLINSTMGSGSKLKRNKSDSTIKRSSVLPFDNQSPMVAVNGNSREKPTEKDPILVENDTPGIVITDTDRQMLEMSEFSIIKALDRTQSNGNMSPRTTDYAPSLKRQRSEDLPLLRGPSQTPLSSQDASLLNLPAITSQDMNLVMDSNLLESTKVIMGELMEDILEDDDLDIHRQLQEQIYDHENVTFTQQNTMQLFQAADVESVIRGLEEHSQLNQSTVRTQPPGGDIGQGSQVARAELNRCQLDASLNLKLISSWNLPAQIEREYKKKGIVEMFDWQVKCLNNPRVLMENKNLVYSAPTSAGKTLVSEILMIKSVLERRKKALLILPFVSVVREKMFYLQDLLTSSGIRVDGFFGGYSPPGGFESTQVAVCTIEKANSIVNKLLEQNKLDSVGVIVVDEVHLIGDPSRGYILELLLAKVLYMTRRHPTIKIQVVSMSATLPKLELLCDWLEADMFVTDFRPVVLNEMIKINRNIYDNKLELLRSLTAADLLGTDQDNVAHLCLETILDKCSVIVFCPTKDRCQKLALTVAETIYNLLKKNPAIAAQLRETIVESKIAEVKSQLKLNCPTGLDEILSKTITYGCAFHHASLTTEERDIIETSFKSGAIKLIAATSTLSSGVNLPARRVIIRTPMFGGKPMNALVYKQMIGRAGRTGKDTVGESILVCTDQDKGAGEGLVVAKLLDPVTSCLVTRNASGVVEYNMNNMKRAMLEIIAAGVATTDAELKIFVRSTLFYVEHCDLFQDLDFEAVARQKHLTKGIRKHPGQEMEEEELEGNALQACIKFLIEYEFIRVQVNEGGGEGEAEEEIHFLATRLGLACLNSSLPPADGFLLFSELQRSRQCFVLESELQAIYLVTPYSVCNQMNDIDWLLFLDMWEKLPAALQRVGELVGIRDSFIVRAMRGLKKTDYKLVQIHKRFFIALALQELVNEVPILQVAMKFKLSRGILQSLQQIAGTFAGIVTSFCNSLNWTMLSLIVGQFKERLFFGIHPDLMDLMRIPSLNSQRARALHKSGIETLLDLAQSNVFVVEKVLYDQAEFQSEKQLEGEHEYDTEERKKVRNFFVTGRVGITVKEGAALVIKEARDFLEMEMGIQNIKWSTQQIGKTANGEREDGEDDRGEKKPLKRHSTEELLDDMASGESKKNKTEGSFGAKFSKELFNLEAERSPQQPPEKLAPGINRKMPVKPESDSDSTDDNGGEDEVVNQSHLMNANKYEIDRPVNLTKINIVHCCKNLEVFHRLEGIIDNCKKSLSIGLSVGVAVTKESERQEPDIIIGGFRKKPNQESNRLEIDSKRHLSGLAISFASKFGTAFYFDMDPEAVVPLAHKIRLLKALFQKKKLTIYACDAKEQLKVLYQTIPGLVIGPDVRFIDPKVANWLMLTMAGDHYMNHFHQLVKSYTPEYNGFLDSLCLDHAKEIYASGLDGDNDIPVETRASVESILVLRIFKYQQRSMEPKFASQVRKVLKTVEMPIQVILAIMECTGISINVEKMEGLIDQMKAASVMLEQKIYACCGTKFNLRSTKELKRIMGIVKGAKATLKEVLEEKNTPLTRLILQYRKVGGILNKMIFPMSRSIENERIYSNNMCYTVSGRINMAEPSIQTLAKDFTIETNAEPLTISLRGLFEPKLANRCFVSADFCQLELRILAHFCEDKALLKILKSNHDVFQAIAAKWNNISESKVTESLRNDTKQICYGIIYGMGIKSLGAVLRVDEETAKERIEGFHQAYPGIRTFIGRVIKDVSEQGYVETLNGRRRYFPYLQDSGTGGGEEEGHHVQEAAIKAQCERQAVNTKIQGSAADILKMAILNVEKSLRKNRNFQINSSLPCNATGYPASRVDMVLHLHDELMYEVHMDSRKAFAKLLRQSMESAAVSLKVPLRVKVKSGSNWGGLKEL